MGLNVHGMVERAHVALHLAVNKSEGEDAFRRARARITCGGDPAAEDFERAARQVEAFTPVAGGLADLLYVDAATFGAFTAALGERVEAILRSVSNDDHGMAHPMLTHPSGIQTLAQLHAANDRPVAPVNEGQPKATAGGSSRTVNQPPPEAFAAYRYWILKDETQVSIAKRLSSEFRRPIDQGRISRWLSWVKRWIKAGNVLPDLTPQVRSKPTPLDPADIDKGRNAEGRVKRQRHRAADE